MPTRQSSPTTSRGVSPSSQPRDSPSAEPWSTSAKSTPYRTVSSSPILPQRPNETTDSSCSGTPSTAARAQSAAVPLPQLHRSSVGEASIASSAAEKNGDTAAAPGFDSVPLPPPATTATATTATTTKTTMTTTATTAAATADASPQAWAIDFSYPALRRKTTKNERNALRKSRLRQQAGEDASSSKTDRNDMGVEGGTATTSPGATATQRASDRRGMGVDSEGNATMTKPARELPVMQVDGLANLSELIPTNLNTTRANLEQRLVLRLPRLLCVNKQYPRSCGISSLTSIYNYLYSWLGESAVGADRPPHSQEELMSILGFAPPFGEFEWGSFTGNGTLLRWFHALNRHFGLSGRASILYKVHGHGKTTHLYPNNEAALAAVKAALRDPHCALIYHCHNHYMVPIGYQEIPQAQVDFLKPNVPESNCNTTIFIGEVSRGRHEAMYARRWELIVQDIECESPFFFNIRHPEQGVQQRVMKRPKSKAKGQKKEGGDDTTAAPAQLNDAENSATPTSAVEKATSGGAETQSPTTSDAAVDAASPVPETPNVEPAGTPAPSSTTQRESRNLHCLILFRNDEVEENLDKFEEASAASVSDRSVSGDSVEN